MCYGTVPRVSKLDEDRAARLRARGQALLTESAQVWRPLETEAWQVHRNDLQWHSRHDPGSWSRRAGHGDRRSSGQHPGQLSRPGRLLQQRLLPGQSFRLPERPHTQQELWNSSPQSSSCCDNCLPLKPEMGRGSLRS